MKLIIEVPDSQISERSGKTKDGRVWEIREQEGYLHVEGKPFPVEMKLQLNAEQTAYKPGKLRDEKTSIRMIDALIQSAVGASLETLPADSDRVLQSTFKEWAKVHLDPYLLTEFRLVILEEGDKSIVAEPLWQKRTQIKGPKARRNRLREFVEAENINTDPLSITKEELHRRFYEANPDIAVVKLGTFEADLNKLKIKGKAGRPPSF